MDDSGYGRKLDARMVLYGGLMLVGSIVVVGYAVFLLVGDAFEHDPVGFTIKASGVVIALGLGGGIAWWRRRAQQAKWEALDKPVGPQAEDRE